MDKVIELTDKELKLVSGGIAYHTILYRNRVVDMDEIKKYLIKRRTNMSDKELDHINGGAGVDCGYGVYGSIYISGGAATITGASPGAGIGGGSATAVADGDNWNQQCPDSKWGLDDYWS